jgi:hypothetical protein
MKLFESFNIRFTAENNTIDGYRELHDHTGYTAWDQQQQLAIAITNHPTRPLIMNNRFARSAAIKINCVDVFRSSASSTASSSLRSRTTGGNSIKNHPNSAKANGTTGSVRSTVCSIS